MSESDLTRRPIVVTLTLAVACAAGCSREQRDSASNSPTEAAAPPGHESTWHHPEATQPASDPRVTAPWSPPVPTAAEERVEERRRMVETQIANPRDGRRPVTAPKVLEAMRIVPRHVFVPAGRRHLAYIDAPLPIGHDQTISQPYIVALMTEMLGVRPTDRVLEIGTGSGYQVAVLAQLTPHVYSIELLQPLADRARRALDEQGYAAVRTRCGDGFRGWPEAAPFDAIVLTCAIDEIPAPLWEQLAPGGRIVMPQGDPAGMQELVVHRKSETGHRETERVIPVRFVPLVRESPQP